MQHSGLVYIVCAFGGFCKALSAEIQTQHTVMAAVGEEAYLNCQLLQTRDVLQVTWQKISPGREENLATYNKFFGRKVNRGFRDKVEFKEAGLQNSSIVIRKVSEKDQCCYRCMFNTYPDGALTGSTCLQLYELHEPVLHVGESERAEEAVVSCSATGRPAPTVTLSVLQQDLQLSNHSSVSVSNTNGTATVTATAVLPRLRDNSTQVGCAVRVLSGPQIEVFVMAPEVKQGLDEEPESNDIFTWIIVLAVLACGCAAIFAVLLLRRHQKSPSHRDSERNKTPLKPSTDTHEIRTPALQHVNEQLRQRSTGSTRKSRILKASSLREPKCQRQLFLPQSPP